MFTKCAQITSQSCLSTVMTGFKLTGKHQGVGYRRATGLLPAHLRLHSGRRKHREQYRNSHSQRPWQSQQEHKVRCCANFNKRTIPVLHRGSYADLLLSLFRYSILDKDCPISINPFTGQLSTLRMLDRELEATHVFQVKAQEEPSGASHSRLLILFPLNYRTSDKKKKIKTMCFL